MKYNEEFAAALEDLAVSMGADIEIKDNGSEMWVADYAACEWYSVTDLLVRLKSDSIADRMKHKGWVDYSLNSHINFIEQYLENAPDNIELTLTLQFVLDLMLTLEEKGL